MDKILGWTPVLWTLRASVIIVVGGVSFAVALYLSRYFRPKHLWRMLTADLPRFKRVGGSVTVLGQEIAASATLDTISADESNALDRRVTKLEEQVRTLIGFEQTLLESVTTGGAADVKRTTAGEGAPGGAPGGAC